MGRKSHIEPQKLSILRYKPEIEKAGVAQLEFRKGGRGSVEKRFQRCIYSAL